MEPLGGSDMRTGYGTKALVAWSKFSCCVIQHGLHSGSIRPCASFCKLYRGHEMSEKVAHKAVRCAEVHLLGGSNAASCWSSDYSRVSSEPTAMLLPRKPSPHPLELPGLVLHPWTKGTPTHGDSHDTLLAWSGS